MKKKTFYCSFSLSLSFTQFLSLSFHWCCLKFYSFFRLQFSFNHFLWHRSFAVRTLLPLSLCAAVCFVCVCLMLYRCQFSFIVVCLFWICQRNSSFLRNFFQRKLILFFILCSIYPFLLFFPPLSLNIFYLFVGISFHSVLQYSITAKWEIIQQWINKWVEMIESERDWVWEIKIHE